MNFSSDSDYLVCVDESNQIINFVPRQVCHGNPEHLHRVVHVHILNSSGQILSQKRSKRKIIQPGKWDSAVGGHVDPGETFIDAARREYKEELGIEPQYLEYLYEYIWISDMESEWVRTYMCHSDAQFFVNKSESEALAFFSKQELNDLDDKWLLTPNFRFELKCLFKYLSDPDKTFSPSFFYPIRSICTCEKCSRLVSFRSNLKPKSTNTESLTPPTYWNKPVPGWGDPEAILLIIGLAPGAHGANRTGRVFTGDSAGDILYRSLHEMNLCSRAKAIHRGDGLELKNVFITNAVKCVPPQNRPNALEIKTCRYFLLKELELLPQIRGIVTLGGIAFKSTIEALRSIDNSIPRLSFKHGQITKLPGHPLIKALYHPSRRNMNTGLLTYSDFHQHLSGFYQILKESA